MNPSTRLRFRLLAALAASGPLVMACGAEVEGGEEGGTGGNGSTTGTGGNGVTGTGGAFQGCGPLTNSELNQRRSRKMMECGSCGVYPTEMCYPLESIASELRSCAAPAEAGRCPSANDLTDLPCLVVLPGGRRVDNDCCYDAESYSCAVEGRPFVVCGQARCADAVQRTDWCAALSPAALDPETQLALAEAWLRDARFEHASVASFARCTLRLLEHGAPPDLVADTQQAGLDEVDHAGRCFSLAARYGGSAVGPGLLAMQGALEPTSLAEFAAATSVEACIGETIAALVAAAQYYQATDPAVRKALGVIAEDEARHAELGWRTVAWALGVGGAAVQRAVKAAFATGMRKAESDWTAHTPEGIDAEVWRAHGRLTASELQDVVSAALRETIAPCAAALCDREDRRSQSARTRCSTPA